MPEESVFFYSFHADFYEKYAILTLKQTNYPINGIVMNSSLEQLTSYLEDLENLTGSGFIWKATAAMLVQFALPEKHRQHICPFCTAVKQKGQDYEDRCMANDNEKISRKALEWRVPFVHRCHAGAEELIIPIFNGDQYQGAIFCGPFQSQDAESGYAEADQWYQKLPQLSEVKRDAIIRITQQLLQTIPDELGAGTEDSRLLPNPDLITDTRIRQAVNLIRNNFRRRLTVPALARQCGLSESRFLHLFKAQTQLNFSEYLLRLRTDEAERLLNSTGLQMNEIAEACGFSDQSHFAAVFNRYNGQPPTAYRRKRLTAYTA